MIGRVLEGELDKCIRGLEGRRGLSGGYVFPKGVEEDALILVDFVSNVDLSVGIYGDLDDSHSNTHLSSNYR
jgi:hypothetical protein